MPFECRSRGGIFFCVFTNQFRNFAVGYESKRDQAKAKAMDATHRHVDGVVAPPVDWTCDFSIPLSYFRDAFHNFLQNQPAPSRDIFIDG